MSLYFAPAFFGHLLWKCIKRKNPIVEVMKLGFVVLGTFALVWWPFLHSYEAAMQLDFVLSVLIPSLLALQEPQLYGWLMYFGIFSMYPLICHDHLLLQYIAVLGLFVLIYYSLGGSSKKGVSIPSRAKAVPSLALLCSLLFQVLYLQIEPPKRYSFLFDALIVFICFSQFVILTLYTNR